MLHIMHFVHNINKHQKRTILKPRVLHKPNLLCKPVRRRKHNFIFNLFSTILLLIKRCPHIMDQISDA